MEVALVINHAPWRPERVAALEAMIAAMGGQWSLGPIVYNDQRFGSWQPAGKTEWMRSQWELGLESGADHILFLTDDLNLAPGFPDIVRAIVNAVPDKAIGLVGNHPAIGRRPAGAWYRCRAWLVGPALLIPRAILEPFYDWWAAKPAGGAPGCKGYHNDDSWLNEYLSAHGLDSWHPIISPVEHRIDLASTVGHGDSTSYQRLSWRRRFSPLYLHGLYQGWVWQETGEGWRTELMRRPEYWAPTPEPPLWEVSSKEIEP